VCFFNWSVIDLMWLLLRCHRLTLNVETEATAVVWNFAFGIAMVKRVQIQITRRFVDASLG